MKIGVQKWNFIGVKEFLRMNFEEVEKFKLGRKIFSSWKIKRKGSAEFERIFPLHSLKSYPLDHESLLDGIHGVFIILS